MPASRQARSHERRGGWRAAGRAPAAGAKRAASRNGHCRRERAHGGSFERLRPRGGERQHASQAPGKGTARPGKGGAAAGELWCTTLPEAHSQRSELNYPPHAHALGERGATRLTAKQKSGPVHLREGVAGPLGGRVAGLAELGPGVVGLVLHLRATRQQAAASAGEGGAGAAQTTTHQVGTHPCGSTRAGQRGRSPAGPRPSSNPVVKERLRRPDGAAGTHWGGCGHALPEAAPAAKRADQAAASGPTGALGGALRAPVGAVALLAVVRAWTAGGRAGGELPQSARGGAVFGRPWRHSLCARAATPLPMAAAGPDDHPFIYSDKYADGAYEYR